MKTYNYFMKMSIVNKNITNLFIFCHERIVCLNANKEVNIRIKYICI